MSAVEVLWNDRPVGSLTLDDGVRPTVEFSYAAAWLRDGFAILREVVEAAGGLDEVLQDPMIADHIDDPTTRVLGDVVSDGVRSATELS